MIKFILVNSLQVSCPRNYFTLTLLIFLDAVSATGCPYSLGKRVACLGLGT